MSKTKMYEQICDDFFEFKLMFSHIFYLMKLFHFLYIQIVEMGIYPENKRYLANSCLYSLNEAINQVVNKANEQISSLYEDLTNIKEDLDCA